VHRRFERNLGVRQELVFGANKISNAYRRQPVRPFLTLVRVQECVIPEVVRCADRTRHRQTGAYDRKQVQTREKPNPVIRPVAVSIPNGHIGIRRIVSAGTVRRHQFYLYTRKPLFQIAKPRQQPIEQESRHAINAEIAVARRPLQARRGSDNELERGGNFGEKHAPWRRQVQASAVSPEQVDPERSDQGRVDMADINSLRC
jgi:hypothetical protein